MKKKFGKFELLERLGGGGMAEVFRARLHGPSGFAKDVALKLILPQFSDEPDFVKMFIHEATVAAQLDHASIVRIHEFDQIDGTYYIAMELVDGKDLRAFSSRSRSRERPLSVAEALAIAMEVARGLAFAHGELTPGREPIIHRDISPHNIIVSRAGEVKITDFGIAKMASTASLTKTGVIKGKASYMSPEQARGEPVDARSDIFSLGCVLWELLTGQRLFSGENDLAILEKLQRCQIEPCSSYNSAVSKELDELVARALQRQPADRYARAGDLARDIDRLLSHEVSDRTYLLADLYRDLFGDARAQTAVLPAVDGDEAAGEAGSAGTDAITADESAPAGKFPPAQVAVAAQTTATSTEPEQPAALVPSAPPDEPDPLVASATTPDAVAGDAPEPVAGGPHTLGPDEATEIATRQIAESSPRSFGSPLLRWLVLPVVVLVLGGIYWLVTSSRSSATGPAGDSSEPPPAMSAGVTGSSAGRPAESGDGGLEKLRQKTAAWLESLATGTTTEPESHGAGSGSPGGSPGSRSGAQSARLPHPEGQPTRAKSPNLSTVDAPSGPRRAAVASAPAVRPGGNKTRPPTRRVGGGGRGKLELNAIPWAKVFWRGRYLGDTPLRNTVLPAGRHKLVLVNPELGVRQTITVHIKSRQTARRLVDLSSNSK